MDDMKVLLDLSTQLPDTHPTCSTAISLATRVLNTIDLKDSDSLRTAHRLVSSFFGCNSLEVKDVCKLQHEVFYINTYPCFTQLIALFI